MFHKVENHSCLQQEFCLKTKTIEFSLLGYRVAELGSLSSGAKKAMKIFVKRVYESIATVGENRVWWRADFQSGSRVLKKVF